MIRTKLHHFEAVGNLIHQWQVQNSRADKPSEHDRYVDLLHYDLGVDTVASQLEESHHDQCELQDESQHNMHEYVDSLLLPNLEHSLLVVENLFVLDLFGVGVFCYFLSFEPNLWAYHNNCVC